MSEETYTPTMLVRDKESDEPPREILRANFDPSRHVRVEGLEATPADDGPEQFDGVELDEDTTIRVGDQVQWLSQGAYQLEEPGVVRAIEESPDGELFAFIEGSETGIPVEQLVAVTAVDEGEE